MSSPLKKFERKCYESQHMHPREFGLLSVLQRITNGAKRTLFFDGRTVATWFSEVKKDAVYRSARKLVREGWLIPVNTLGKKRTTAGRYEATMFQVLTHQEWTAKHGTDKCKDASLENETGPVSNTRQVQSRKCKTPVSKTRHSFVVPCLVKESSVKECPVGASPESLDLDQRQTGSGVATLSTASSRENETGDHTVPTLAELRAKLEHFSKHGGCELEEYRALQAQVEFMSRGERQ